VLDQRGCNRDHGAGKFRKQSTGFTAPKLNIGINVRNITNNQRRDSAGGCKIVPGVWEKFVAEQLLSLDASQPRDNEGVRLFHFDVYSSWHQRFQRSAQAFDAVGAGLKIDGVRPRSSKITVNEFDRRAADRQQHVAGNDVPGLMNGDLEITPAHTCLFSIRLASNHKKPSRPFNNIQFIKSQDKRRADLATKKDKTDPPPHSLDRPEKERAGSRQVRVLPDS
jgi:hypothetical protein